jgi:hypothetical protein
MLAGGSVFGCRSRVSQDSVFCRQGSASVTVFNISDPNVAVATETATVYCWDGTFGSLLSDTGKKQWAYTTPIVTWKMECELGFLLYNQCIISALVAIILMAFGSTVFLIATTALCICFGCCNCCFVKRKYAESDDDKVRTLAPACPPLAAPPLTTAHPCSRLCCPSLCPAPRSALPALSAADLLRPLPVRPRQRRGP